ncbi:hypothetical protein SUGI_0670760 [Cryptomeria japonica]|uniref:3-ketoacyl-CoA synthase 10 n=1 Tax=Cryptomeria japonica TaxID=3369 RepID=UPI0024147232|nr:3-ketoacyl-CoA synthase 10 [Cryptomeria japonica]GLJ33340.1 hypothetical protein SUGI_0670760 [Cryptomeria japonica]
MEKEQARLSTEIVARGVESSGPNAGFQTFSVRVRRKLPDFLLSVNLRHVKLGYHYVISNALYFLVVVPLLVIFSAEVGTLRRDDLWRFWDKPSFDLVSLLYVSGLLGFIASVYYMCSSRPIYLVDFACYKPSDEFKVTRDYFMSHSRNSGLFDEKSLEFQQKILERSGLGEDTYFPEAILASPPRLTLKEARAEAEMVMFGALDELFEKCKVRPKDIGILVVNCSLFNPTPSLSAVIINHYKMRGNILSFNLGGMGCSAGVIALDLAQDMLQIHGDSYAVVVSTENITLNWYHGTNRSMLLPNCLFRMGGAAILLSNKRKDRRRSKYQLSHIVRTHNGQDDRSYQCVFQEEDSNKIKGLTISKELMAVAGHALKANITTLGPLVLPLSEQILFFLALFSKKVLKMDVKPYIPDFSLAFEHFCIHAGGRAVLDELQKNLSLSDHHMEPSRMTLHRFGNTSSSTLWYELAYMEAKKSVKRGDRLWQIAFGSGFKCNSAVWKALRTIKIPTRNPWLDCIDNYPVEIPEFQKI